MLRGLIRHPVGRTSAAGRWYLACISMLALLLLSLHFAVQERAQQQAREMVAKWAGQQGVAIAAVQYRMMRGALTLDDFHVRREGMELKAASLLLQGDVTSLMNMQPRLSLLELRDVQLQLAGVPSGFQIAEESYDPMLARLWRSARAVVVEGGTIRVGAGGGVPFRPVDLRLLRFRARGSGDARHAKGEFQLLGGHLELQAESVWGDGAAPQLHGHTRWQGVDAARFLQDVTGWQPVAGELGGEAAWTVQADGNVVLTGGTKLAVAGGKAAPARLQWTGGMEAGRWKGAVEAAQWPLVMFAGSLPSVAQRHLDGGLLNGEVDISLQNDDWHVAGKALTVDGLRLQRAVVQGDDPHLWQAEQASLRGLDINVAGRKFYLEQLRLVSVDAKFDSAATEAASNGWDLRIDAVDVEALRPSINLGEGRLFNLPPLAGRAIWRAGGWSVSLNDDGSEGWRISGEIALRKDSSNRLVVKAEEAPLVRFRPLLPPLLRSGGAELEGTVHARGELSAQAGAWSLAGHARIENVYVGLFGDNWFADTAEIDLTEAGGALPGPHIGVIQFKGWRYRAALYPLARADQVASITHADARGWFGTWHVDRLLMARGTVAVGQAAAVWMEDVDVELSGIAPQAYAALTLRSRFDGGSMFASGRIGFSSSRPHVDVLKLSVRDVLPFFAREWLQLSGIPALQRGRLYGDLTLREGDAGWQGVAYVRLQHGLLEQNAFPQDPLLELTGFNTHELFSRLSNGAVIRLKAPIEGRGTLAGVTGESLVRTVRRAVEEAGSGVERLQLQTLSQVRLHEREALSHNERVRMRSAIRTLKEQPKWVVELLPQLGERELDAQTVAQVRYTQQLMVRFLQEYGIAPERVFPVWPGVQHRGTAGASGIVLRAGM